MADRTLAMARDADGLPALWLVETGDPDWPLALHTDGGAAMSVSGARQLAQALRAHADRLDSGTARAAQPRTRRQPQGGNRGR